mgnify:CR=1 FL=1
MAIIEKSVLITSLILSMDKVSNDMGHQVSYLKKWTKILIPIGNQI